MTAGPAPETAGIGQRLVHRREELGYTLEQAAARTRIRKAYLEALEHERFADLPGAAYVSGFLRSYSRFLGIDGDPLVAILVDGGHIKEFAPPPLKTGHDVSRLISRSTCGRKVFMLGLFLVLLFAAVLAYVYRLPPFTAAGIPGIASQGTLVPKVKAVVLEGADVVAADKQGAEVEGTDIEGVDGSSVPALPVTPIE